MGRKSELNKLPGKLLQQFRARLIDSGHTDFRGHVDWLKANGYEISHSAVHRYSFLMRNINDENSAEDAATFSTNLRMRCLEVAALIESTSPPIETANDLYFWVTTGRML